jgi:hypothetical protein
MAARRDRSGLTAKESKIVSKKSRLFDSKTQGIGLPQKSSKATITGRKPGKPKPTAGKGMNKNIVTKGGKAGRAIENKMRSAMNLPKLQTTGKAKAIKKAAAQKPGLETRGAKLTKAEAINRARDYQWNKIETRMEQRFDTMAGGPRAGEKSTAGPGKKNARKTAAISKLAQQKIPVKTPKVPVKPKGRRGLRGGGMLGGGGLRTYNK